jgi:hypothetical protein
LTNEKSRITPKPGGPGPHENSACPAGAEADPSTATAATAPTGASQATLITAQKSGQPVMDRLAFIAIMGGSIVVAPLVSEAQQRVGVLSPGTPPLGPLDALRQGLRELGYEEGRTFSIEWRFPGATDERLSNWTRHAGRERRPVYNGVLTRGREKEDIGPGRLREFKAGITARLAAGEVDSARRGVE